MREGWEYKKLGDLCDIYQPKTLATEQLVVDGKYYVYGANGIIGRYNDYNHEQSEILLTCRGATCGTINISQPYSWINGNAMVIHRKSEDLSFDFLKYLMLSLDYSLIITGAAQPQITRQKIAPIIVKFPSLSVQQSIVSELDKINELIRLKKEQLKDYDNLAQSIFYEMFGDPVVNEKGWEVKHIGDFGTCIAGATPSTTVEEYWINGTIPWLSSGEVSKGRIFNTDRRITQHGYDSCSTRMIPAHTIVIAMAGQGKTRGTVGVAEIPLCTNQSICSIVTNEKIDVDFLYYQIKFLYNELRSASNGDGGRGGLNLRLIKKFPIISPNYSLQVSFAKRIKTVELLKSNIQTTIADLETLLASRMQYWFD